eukprot:PhF_6_TR21702/c0_g1_i2/m.30995
MSFSSYALTIAFILGSGILRMPYAVYHAGAVLGPLFIVLLTLGATTTLMWLSNASVKHGNKPIGEVISKSLGFKATLLWDIPCTLYSLNCMCVYVSIWIERLEMSEVLPTIESVSVRTVSKILCGVCFFVASIVLHPRYSWTRSLYNGITIFHFVNTFLMVVAMSLFSWSNPLGREGAGDVPPLVDVKGLSLLCSSVVFAQMCHMGVGPLVSMLESRRELQHRRNYFAGGLFTTCFMYCIVGLIGATKFGGATTQNIAGLVYELEGLPFLMKMFFAAFPLVATTGAFVACTRAIALIVPSWFPTLAIIITPLVLFPFPWLVVVLGDVSGLMMMFVIPSWVEIATKGPSLIPLGFIVFSVVCAVF